MNAPRGAAVFLDRDGVLNEAVVRDGRPYPPDSLQTLRLCDGVAEGLSALHGAGYRLIVVTNQPDVGAGRQPQPTVEAIHDHMRQLLPLDDVRVCYHTDANGCECRKPKPGMLLDAAADWQIDLGRSFMVGDRWRDIEAGRAAGCRTILIGAGYAERPATGFDWHVESLLEASRVILNEEVHTRDRA
jgi:D-glycero-D-manno-heptose 1,7-bisphosphate phosphatase